VGNARIKIGDVPLNIDKDEWKKIIKSIADIVKEYYTRLLAF
jgi:hypothetical protein